MIQMHQSLSLFPGLDFSRFCILSLLSILCCEIFPHVRFSCFPIFTYFHFTFVKFAAVHVLHVLHVLLVLHVLHSILRCQVRLTRESRAAISYWPSTLLLTRNKGNVKRDSNKNSGSFCIFAGLKESIHRLHFVCSSQPVTVPI